MPPCIPQKLPPTDAANCSQHRCRSSSSCCCSCAYCLSAHQVCRFYPAPPPAKSAHTHSPIIEPIVMLTTSFMRAPAPTSPRNRLRLPCGVGGYFGGGGNTARHTDHTAEDKHRKKLLRKSSGRQNCVMAPSQANYLLHAAPATVELPAGRGKFKHVPEQEQAYVCTAAATAAACQCICQLCLINWPPHSP